MESKTANPKIQKGEALEIICGGLDGCGSKLDPSDVEIGICPNCGKMIA